MPSQPIASGSSEAPKKAKSSSKSKSKHSGKVKSAAFIDTHNEDVDDEETALLRRYEPVSSVREDIDWEELQNDPNVELWAIRVPVDLEPKSLRGLTSFISSSKTASFTTKQGVTYTIGLADSNDDDDNPASSALSTAAGAEMQSFACLLPSKSRNGQVYPAPNPISRRLVISKAATPATLPSSIPTLAPHHSSTCTPPEPGEEAQFPYGHSKRPFQPLGLLKHSFTAIGAGAVGPEDETMEVDSTPAAIAHSLPESPKTTRKDGKEKKEKTKRKHDGAIADPGTGTPGKVTAAAGEGEEADVSPKVRKAKRAKVEA